MDTLGRHIIMDLWDCNQQLLRTKEAVQIIMIDAAVASKADIREVTFHQFEPEGVSGIVVISESHLTIHTFPEHKYASVDVYTCGGMNPHIAMQLISERLQAQSNETIEILRGTIPLKVESSKHHFLYKTIVSSDEKPYH